MEVRNLTGLLVALFLCLHVQAALGRSTNVFHASVAHLRRSQHRGGLHPHFRSHSRRLSALVEEAPLQISYHNGPTLSGDSDVELYIVWYGSFSEAQKSAIVDFLDSIGHEAGAETCSVRSWWKVTEFYRDSQGSPHFVTGGPGGQLSDLYSKGKELEYGDLEAIAKGALSAAPFPANSRAVYLVLTSEDVQVGSFCMNTCGSHHFTAPSQETLQQQLLYLWVGNSALKCAGRCAWPFAREEYGPPMKPLVAPNGDVGVDGMIINIASLLAGTVTNPYNNGYFQGDASGPLEVATSCAGVYGEGAFPGYPGALLVDEISGASYNAKGVNGRQFLLPALWDPASRTCSVSYTLRTDFTEGNDQKGQPRESGVQYE